MVNTDLAEATAGASATLSAPARRSLPRAMIVMPHGLLFGAERALLGLLEELLPGHVSVCCPGGSPLAEEVTTRGHRVVDIALPLPEHESHSFVASYMSSLVALRRAVNTLRPDVLHAFTARSIKIVAPVAVATRTPALLTVQEDTSPSEIGRLKSFSQRVLARPVFPSVLAVSEYVRDRLVTQGFDPGRISIVPTGVARANPPLSVRAARLRLGLPRDRLLFLVVGRIAAIKGQHLAIAAFDQFCRAHPELDATLVIVGGPMKPSDESYARSLTLQIARCAGPVDVIGYQTCIECYFDAADVVIVPSVSPDAFPTVALEAGLAARPVIVTDTGGGREAVIDGETGWVVPADIEPIAEAMASTVDRAWRARVGAAGRRRVESTYTRTSFSEAVVGAWRQVAAARHDPRPRYVPSNAHGPARSREDVDCTR